MIRLKTLSVVVLMTVLAAGTTIAGAPAPPAFTADVATSPGDTVNLTATISVTVSALGSDSDTDSATTDVTATATVGVTPDVLPGASSQLDEFSVAFDPFTLNFELFCLPFIGCQQLNATFTDVVIVQLTSACGVIDGSQNIEYQGALLSATGLVTTTGVAGDSIVLDLIGETEFTTGISERAMALSLSDAGLSAITGEIPPEDLPDGLDALSFTLLIEFPATMLTGTIVDAGMPLDRDIDGVLNGCDNCPDDANTDQADMNGDGIGDACEALPCPADCAPDNGDGTFGNGVVNIDDLLGVINAFGGPGGPCDNSPDNGDGTFGNGVVNIDDLLGVINRFGDCP